MINKLEMEQSLYATLQLACSLIAIVVVAWLVMKYLTPRCSAPDEGAASKGCHVHLCYLVGVGSLLLIELVAYILTGAGEVSDEMLKLISFASTIASILLSVVAIIYSIVSGAKGANLYVKTEEVSKQIGETLPRFVELGGAVTELKKIPAGIAQYLSELKEQLERMEELSSGVSQKVDKVASDISAMSVPRASQSQAPKETFSDQQGQNGSADTASLDLSIGEGENTIFRRYISSSSVWGLYILLACCYSKETGKPVVLTKELFATRSFPVEYLRGYLVSSLAIGIVNSEEEDGKSWKIESVYKGFSVKDEVLEALYRWLKSDAVTEALKDRVRRNIKEIQAYFGVDIEE